MGKVQTIVVVAVAYLALGALSAFFAYSDQDAWGVWLTSGLGLGLLLGRPRSDWIPVLVGAFVGAMIFEPLVGSSLADALGFALIEVIATVVGGVVGAQISAPPLRFASPRDVAAIIAGAFALALTGAVLVGLWDHFTARPDAWRTFRVWLLGNFVAMLLRCALHRVVGAVPAQNPGRTDAFLIRRRRGGVRSISASTSTRSSALILLGGFCVRSLWGSPIFHSCFSSSSRCCGVHEARRWRR